MTSPVFTFWPFGVHFCVFQQYHMVIVRFQDTRLVIRFTFWPFGCHFLVFQQYYRVRYVSGHVYTTLPHFFPDAARFHVLVVMWLFSRVLAVSLGNICVDTFTQLCLILPDVSRFHILAFVCGRFQFGTRLHDFVWFFPMFACFHILAFRVPFSCVWVVSQANIQVRDTLTWLCPILPDVVRFQVLAFGGRFHAFQQYHGVTHVSGAIHFHFPTADNAYVVRGLSWWVCTHAYNL
jgi:hypothetical protein